MSGDKCKEGKISDFFHSTPKRARPKSSTSDSDISLSDKPPLPKRASTVMDNETIKKLIEELNCKINNLATKDDVCEMKTQFKEMTDNMFNRLDGRMEVLEGKMLEEESRTTKVEKDVKVLQGRYSRHQSNFQEHENRVKALERENNDLQQYSRRWNLRVYRVPEDNKAEDCEKKVCDLFSDLVGVKTTPADIEAAHRTGKRSSDVPRPILVRFLNRKKRDAVLAARRQLKGKGFAIDEDLTFLNYALSRKAANHTASLAVWSSNGKVLTKLKNGKIIKLDIHSDVDKVLNEGMREEMNGD